MLSKLLSTLRYTLVCTLPLVAAASLAQTTINVGPGQTYTTIQSGINAAVNGDTVMVAPGTYYENINFKGKAITVASSACSGSGPSNTCNTLTIIDGGNADATVTFNSGEVRNSIISGFTIRDGGYAANSVEYAGGGIYVSGAGPTIINNLITANNCHAIQVEFGAALIQNNTLSGTFGTTNTFFDGSGIILSGNAQLPGLTHSSVISNVIENNLHAHSYDGGGIGLWAVEGTVIQGNIIRNNATSGSGGGIVSFNTDTTTISQNLIYGNQAATNGAISLSPPDDTVGPFIGILGRVHTTS